MNNYSKLISLVLVLLCFLRTNAQSIKVQDCLSFFQNKSLISINELLSKKGWENNSIDDLGVLSNIIWSYKIDNYSDKAAAWIDVSYFSGSIDKIEYQVHNEKSKNIFITSLKSSGFKEKDSYVFDDKILTEYSNDKFIIKYYVSVKESEYYNTKTSIYVFEIIRKFGFFDYENGEQIVFEGEDDNKFIAERNYYINGKKNGYSRIYDSNEKLVKEFTYKNDILEGDFFYFDENGVILTSGKYKNGKLNGELKTFDSQSNYTTIVNYVDDLKNGTFKIEIDGKIIQYGQYQNNLKEGNWIEYYYLNENNVGFPDYKVIGNYINDKKEGVFYYVHFHKQDTNLIMTFKKDILNGNAIYFVEDGEFKGKVKQIIPYINDKQNGISEVYFDYNNETNSYIKVNAFFTYLNGIKEGKSSYEIPNNFKTEGNYYGGKKNGIWEETFFLDGDIIYSQGEFVNDKKNGDWIETFNGKLNEVITFKNGKQERINLFVDDLKVFSFYFNNETFNKIEKFKNNILINSIEFTRYSNKNDVYLKLLSFTGKGESEMYKLVIPKDKIIFDNETEINFWMSFINEIETNKIKFANGEFYKITLTELVNGYYENGLLNGVFSIELKNYKGLRYECFQLNGKPQNEKFFTASGENFSGEVFISYLNQRIKIKNNLRNGYTELLNLNGEVISKLKYKKGVLVK